MTHYSIVRITLEVTQILHHNTKTNRQDKQAHLILECVNE